MKDPCCVPPSFADTVVFDGRIEHPGWWRPLIENSEDWFETKGLDLTKMLINDSNCNVTVCYDAFVWG